MTLAMQELGYAWSFNAECYDNRYFAEFPTRDLPNDSYTAQLIEYLNENKSTDSEEDTESEEESSVDECAE